MKSKRTKKSLRLQLLAFILALALMWYCINPMPRTTAIHRQKRQEDDEPGAKKRGAEIGAGRTAMWPNLLGTLATEPEQSSSSEEMNSEEIDAEDFDWPDIIDA